MYRDASLAVLHLDVWMRWLHARIAAAVARRAGMQAGLRTPGASALCVSAQQAELLLAQCEADLAKPDEGYGESAEHNCEVQLAEIRRAAADAGRPLPLDALEANLGLSEFERFAVVLCAMPEIHPGYERVFAFLQDDLGRRMPAPALISSLLEPRRDRQYLLRHRLSRHARLRRRGVLEECGEELLRLGPNTLAYLCGEPADAAVLFPDPLAVECRHRRPLPNLLAKPLLSGLAAAIRTGQIRFAAFWGPQHAHGEEAVRQVAAAAGLALFRWPPAETETRAVAHAAWSERAAIWMDCDTVFAHGDPRTRETLPAALHHAPVPVFLTGSRPWRPMELLRRGDYWELDVPAPGLAERARHWTLLVPGLPSDEAESLAARFRMNWSEMNAALALSAAALQVDGATAAGSPPPLSLPAACSMVLRRESAQYADVVEPRRGPEHLILPDAAFRQIRELADFYLAHSRVYETWGFSQIATGGGGVKAFFSGEPGTGKTLAAEVVAKLVGLPMLKVDLSRVVSKWVGETEKHLERVFSEAEESHYVLFLDECDALGAKRGEVRAASDKFANLETAYLLQRLEAFRGLAILASNLKDQMDAAMLRRFHVVVHFPMPAEPERLRLWRLALGHDAPLEEGIRLNALAKLEMSGAAIVNAATAAAMMAAAESSPRITTDHVLRGVARQFQVESRILSRSQLDQIGAQIRAVA